MSLTGKSPETLRTIYHCCFENPKTVSGVPTGPDPYCPLDSYEIVALMEAQRRRADLLLHGVYTDEELEKLEEMAQWQAYYSKNKESDSGAV